MRRLVSCKWNDMKRWDWKGEKKSLPWLFRRYVRWVIIDLIKRALGMHTSRRRETKTVCATCARRAQYWSYLTVRMIYPMIFFTTITCLKRTLSSIPPMNPKPGMPVSKSQASLCDEHASRPHQCRWQKLHIHPRRERPVLARWWNFLCANPSPPASHCQRHRHRHRDATAHRLYPVPTARFASILEARWRQEHWQNDACQAASIPSMRWCGSDKSYASPSDRERFQTRRRSPARWWLPWADWWIFDHLSYLGISTENHHLRSNANDTYSHPVQCRIFPLKPSQLLYWLVNFWHHNHSNSHTRIGEDRFRCSKSSRFHRSFVECRGRIGRLLFPR